MNSLDKTELMKQIRDEVLVLEQSPLFEYRTSNKYFPVIGEGSHDAKIMFVGEAPGQNEAKTGRPFCGAAGRVLDLLLEHVDIPRKSVYITNIIKDRPPQNRDPLQSEIDIYAPFLDRQIEIVRPRAIAALGRYAMGYIMKKFDLDLELEPISRAHGKAYAGKTAFGDIDIAVLYHPCVAVYNPNNLESLKKDFEILKKYA
ncbi:MAG: uracil-DNA glycosylase [Candidatus Parcubacteria bacterium]|jgi:DNA polymerase|nr:uracil-DNA glycosylase [Candidatus Parcubacteria bacterium]